MDESTRASLLLNMVPGVGPRLYRRLTERFGGPEQVLAASVSDLVGVLGVGKSLGQAIATARQQIDVQQELDDCERHEIQLLIQGSPLYPPELDRIDDAPPVLYCRGTLLPTDRLAIAMVGSRHVTEYGLRVAQQFGRGLAQAGFCVVSGLARGADAASHRAALAAGGRTIAVLGSGLLNLYPSEHADLAQEIIANGAVLSEVPLHRPPHAGAFPQRNRIVSGLSLGVLVIEASKRSGALITARHAMEQNREVFAIPGRVDNPSSHGCHDLIRDGATLARCVEDILDSLGPLAQPVLLGSPANRGEDPEGRSNADHRQTALTAAAAAPTATGLAVHGSVPGPAAELRQPAELLLNPQETLVLQAIGVEPTMIDQVVALTELPINRVLSTLSVLQARRLIRRIGGTQVARI